MLAAEVRTMSTAAKEWSDPVAYLRSALAQNQFALYCQPIAALSGIVAYPMAEVLIRLREEETALMPPGEFLPVLEHYGMMPELDRWVVREVLSRLSLGPEIPRFSINLSCQTIADPHFADFVADALAAQCVPADCLVFEIDEVDAGAAPRSVRRLCASLGSLGAGVLIDGFGRGGDPKAALGLPCVQYVKLHCSLTRNLATEEAAAAKIHPLLALAADRGIAAIAECVECDEVLACLRALKVRYAQGFGICAPQAIDLIAELPAIRFSQRRRNDTTLVPVQGLLDLTGNSLSHPRWVVRPDAARAS
jgi:EAL domain-containing protein (putative c-di-GMP-specific phosphodiesterase class I)